MGNWVEFDGTYVRSTGRWIKASRSKATLFAGCSQGVANGAPPVPSPPVFRSLFTIPTPNPILGYPCQNLIIPASTNHTLRLAGVPDKPRVYPVVERNLENLETILRWNAERDIRVFRIGSSLIPFASHPTFPTWQGRPKVHISSQAPDKPAGPHADYIDPKDWRGLAKALDGRDADVMVEAKQKDKALFELRRVVKRAAASLNTQDSALRT